MSENDSNEAATWRFEGLDLAVLEHMIEDAEANLSSAEMALRSYRIDKLQDLGSYEDAAPETGKETQPQLNPTVKNNLGYFKQQVELKQQEIDRLKQAREKLLKEKDLGKPI